MRLCERDGAFDFAAYSALNREVTWQEALRINTAIVIIGDERAHYAEWRGHSDKATAPTPLPSALTLADYKRELDDARGHMNDAQQMLMRHRRAVVAKTDEGRLADSDVTHFETIVTICKNRIDGVETHLRTLVADAEQREAAAAKGVR
jgi:hypothetical protein